MQPVLLSPYNLLSSFPAVYLWASAVELLEIGRCRGTEEKVSEISKAKRKLEKRGARHKSEGTLTQSSVSSSGAARYF